MWIEFCATQMRFCMKQMYKSKIWSHHNRPYTQFFGLWECVKTVAAVGTADISPENFLQGKTVSIFRHFGFHVLHSILYGREKERICLCVCVCLRLTVCKRENERGAERRKNSDRKSKMERPCITSKRQYSHIGNGKNGNAEQYCNSPWSFFSYPSQFSLSFFHTNTYGQIEAE